MHKCGRPLKLWGITPRVSMVTCLTLICGLSMPVSATEQWQTFRALLKAKNFSAINSQLSESQIAYERGEMTDLRLSELFNALPKPHPGWEPYYDDWIRAHPRSGIAYLARGLYFYKRGWQQRGTNFIRYTPPENIKAMEQSFQRAVADLQTATQRIKKCALCYATLIDINMALGEDGRVEELVRQAMAMDKSALGPPRAYLHSLLPIWGGSFPEMANFVSYIKKQQPGSLLAKALEADYYRALGDHARPNSIAAVNYYQTSLSLFEDWRTVQFLGYSYQLMARNQEAIKAYVRVLELVPWDMWTKFALARARIEGGDVEQGIKDLEALAVLEKGLDASSSRTLGYGYELTGRYTEAMEMYARAIALDSTDSWSRTALARASVASGSRPQLQRLEQAAEQGDLSAQAALIDVYAWGHTRGNSQDFEKAWKWCPLAASRGLPSAQYCLAGLHYYGYGRAVDYGSAAHWMKLAAQAGNLNAITDLGVMYWEGHGVAQNHQEAIRLWLDAAEQGNPRAEAKLKQHADNWFYFLTRTWRGIKRDMRALLQRTRAGFNLST